MRPDSSETPAVHPVGRSRVLLVCWANVCRSPSMQFHLDRTLARAAPGVPWDVTSAGADVRPGEPMCRHAAKSITRAPGGGEFAAKHRSQILTRSLVESAGLVLLASTQERAAVAALSPAARRRTFTLREAAMMMTRGLPPQDDSWALVTEEDQLLPTLVDLLHEQRGTLAISVGPAHFSTRRRGLGDRGQLDIGDAHQQQGPRHKSVLQAVVDASTELASGVGRVAVLPTTTAPSAVAPVGERPVPSATRWGPA